MSQGSTSTVVAVVAALLLPLFLASKSILRQHKRSSKIPRTHERVLIIGASSGIGRALALAYASRGARLCIVARRNDEIQKVVEECNLLMGDAVRSLPEGSRYISGIQADFSNAGDMVRVRAKLESELKGVDTVVVCAGVSALRPVLEIAGLQRNGRTFDPPQASAEGIQHTVDVANKAANANYIGPLVSAVTLLPLLHSTSTSPSILLISSLAAIVPAPTRAIYGSTKAASLLLYQALSIEHPAVTFTHCIPATVEGGFRASAVDGGDVREADPNKHGLKVAHVAERCIKAVDAQEKFVFMPWWYGRLGHILYWLLPVFVEGRARRKYAFTT